MGIDPLDTRVNVFSIIFPRKVVCAALPLRDWKSYTRGTVLQRNICALYKTKSTHPPHVDDTNQVIRYMEDKLRQRDAMTEKLRLKNTTLKGQLQKVRPTALTV